LYHLSPFRDKTRENKTTISTTMSTVDGLQPYALLGGYNAEELWSTIDLTFLTWFLIFFAPRWKYTPKLTLIGPVIHAAIYSLSAISLFLYQDHNDGSAPDFVTFEGVVHFMKDPNGVFVAWIHYVCYDALVGRWIVLDSVERGCSLWVHVLAIIPILFVSLMLGPMGWLMYFVIRTFLIPVKDNGATKSKSS